MPSRNVAPTFAEDGIAQYVSLDSPSTTQMATTFPSLSCTSAENGLMQCKLWPNQPLVPVVDEVPSLRLMADGLADRLLRTPVLPPPFGVRMRNALASKSG